MHVRNLRNKQCWDLSFIFLGERNRDARCCRWLCPLQKSQALLRITIIWGNMGSFSWKSLG